MTKDYNILIPDIGIGNIRSLSRAILYEKEFTYKLIITKNPSDITSNSCVVFPGVGNYGEVMNRLINTGWELALKKHINKGGIFIGICVGFQILFKGSEESNSEKGLDLFNHKIWKLKDFNYLPVIGYHDVFSKNEKKMGKFYFIHSFGIEITEKILKEISQFEYYYYCYKNKKILAGIKNKNFIGLQFHPEKSKTSGINFLNNIIKKMGVK
ncbi:imidazole glycerol phosphate synthase subunit HisH [Alphaproteobacteria bacterium]|nr:imidazole glycerol phosphate synthase subunit HisH [Alphaproteobacteria bacterium]